MGIANGTSDSLQDSLDVFLFLISCGEFFTRNGKVSAQDFLLEFLAVGLANVVFGLEDAFVVITHGQLDNVSKETIGTGACSWIFLEAVGPHDEIKG